MDPDDRQGLIARSAVQQKKTKTFKQIGGSNKFLIAGDGKMKRMREPWDRTHWRDASNESERVQNSARGSIEAAEVHKDNEMRGWRKRVNKNKHPRLKWPSEDWKNLQNVQDL